MIIVLYHPQIPQNTGNIVRTCAVAGCEELILVQPGFSTTDRQLKRAGLDYWEGVEVSSIEDLEAYLASTSRNFYFFSSKAKNSYFSVPYEEDSILIFGSETEGLPAHYFQNWPEKFLTIPMKPNARCLNLATTVGIAVYEGIRKQNYSGTGTYALS